MKQFSISEALKFGWNTTIAHFWFIIRIILILIIIGILIGFTWSFAFLGTFLSSFIGERFTLMQNSQSHYLATVSISLTQALLMAGALFLVSSVIQVWCALGIIRIGLNLYDTHTAQFSDLLKEWRLIGNCILAKCIYNFLIFVGLLFFIIPGLYALITFWFYQQAIVDKQLGPIDALNYSRTLTKNSRLHLFGFFIVTILIMSVSSACFGIGLFIGLPVIILANIYVYRKLIYYKEHAQT